MFILFRAAEGTPLPVSLRQVVHKNGSLVIDNVQKNADSGSYACTASTNSGDKSTQQVQVRVLGKSSYAVDRGIVRATRGGMGLRTGRTDGRWRGHVG